MKDSYVSPLNSRYASKEMKYLFSPDKKFVTWRKLWIALAESERELGLDIPEEAIKEMREHISDACYLITAQEDSLVVLTSSNWTPTR